MEKEQKPKRVLSPEQLEKLKVAREKALKVRQANAEQRKKEKDLKKLEKQAKQKEIEEKLMNYQEGSTGASASDNQELSASHSIENEPEEEAPPVKKPKKKTKKPIVIVEESDSSESEDEQVVYIKRAKGKRPVAEKPLERTQSGFADWGRQNTFGGGFYRR